MKHMVKWKSRRTAWKKADAGGTGFFPWELLLFSVLAFSRFFDHKLNAHAGTPPLMKSYEAALVLTIIYVLLVLAFGVTVCKKAIQETKRESAYLTSFFMVFMVPFFLHKYYFGTLDMAVWIPVTAALLFLVKTTGELSLKREWAAMVLVVLPALILAVVLGFYKKDVQTLLSGRQFVLLLVFFSPYLFAAVRFVQRLCRGAEPTRRKLYTFSAFFGILPAAVWAAAGDYSRCVFYGFVCAILLTVSFMATGDVWLIQQLKKEKEEVQKWLPIPEVFVFYPLIFITFWMMGWESIPVEEILKLQ